MFKSQHQGFSYFDITKTKKQEILLMGFFGGAGTYEQQFIYSIYIFTDKLFLFKPELPVVCWGVSGVLYSFLLQEPTEVKWAMGIFN